MLAFTPSFVLDRKVRAPTYTRGGLIYCGMGDKNEFLGYTLEDPVREGEHVQGDTAIPALDGWIRLTMSNRFGRIMPLISDTPYDNIIQGDYHVYEGVRVHGGNDVEDTEGCPLLASHYKDDKVWGCKEVNERLIDILEAAKYPCRFSIINS